MIAGWELGLHATLSHIGMLRARERELTMTCARLAIETPELEAKLYVGRCVYDHAASAKAWDSRLAELAAESGDGAIDLNACGTAVSTGQRFRDYGEFGLRSLADAYRRYLAESPEILDEPSRRLVEMRLVSLQRQQDELADVLQAIVGKGLAATASPIVGNDYRAPVQPERDPRFVCDRPLVDPLDAGLPLADQAIQLMHANLTDLEIPTIEVCCRFILENPVLGWDFTLDMARQSWDESRHAAAFHRRIIELGGRVGDRQTNMALWTMTHPQSLVVALTAHQMIGEWIGVDGALWFADYFRERGDAKTASLFEFVARDECTHVAFGIKWIDRLLPDQADKDQVVAEAEALRNSHGKATVGPLTFPFNRWACEASGYSAAAADRLEARYRSYGSKVPSLHDPVPVPGHALRNERDSSMRQYLVEK